MLAPTHRHIATHRGSAPTPLVVIAQPSPLRQRVEVGEQVIVMRTRPAVEHHNVRPDANGAGENLDIPDGDRLFRSDGDPLASDQSRVASAPATRRTASSSAGEKPLGRSLSMSISPRISAWRRMRTTNSERVSMLHAR